MRTPIFPDSADPEAPEPPADPEAFEELIEQAPRLGLIRPFLGRVREVAWFGMLGEGLRAPLRETARRYLDELGFPDVEVTPVRTWEEAADAAAILDWESPAWEAEEQLRAALTMEAGEALGEDVLSLTLTHVAAETASPIRASLSQLAALWDVRDAEVVNAAAGGAVQACHHAALTLLTGRADDEHPFVSKFALYEAGRWPVGVAGASLNLF